MSEERAPEEPEQDPTVEEETDAAAGEASSIGGSGSAEDLDPAEQPVAEGGGGQAEGFEQAESDLIEHASHGDPAPDPSSEEQISREPDEEEAAHGAPDQVHSTQKSDEQEEH